jgi:hypothetical protein
MRPRNSSTIIRGLRRIVQRARLIEAQAKWSVYVIKEKVMQDALDWGGGGVTASFTLRSFHTHSAGSWVDSRVALDTIAGRKTKPSRCRTLSIVVSFT